MNGEMTSTRHKIPLLRFHLTLWLTFLLGCHAQFATFQACGTQQETILAEFNGSHQKEIVLNGPEMEYFLIYVQREADDTSVLGQRFFSNGILLGDPVPIYPNAQDSGLKANPTVAVNTRDHSYMVAFQVTHGDQTQIYVQRVEKDGTLFGVAKLINDDQLTIGTNPQLAYNGVEDNFLLAFEAQTEGNSSVHLQVLNITGEKIGEMTTIENHQKNMQPRITFDLTRNRYMLSVLNDTQVLSLWVDSVASSKNSTFFTMADLSLMFPTPENIIYPNYITQLYVPEMDRYFLAIEASMEDRKNFIVVQAIDGSNAIPHANTTVGIGNLELSIGKPTLAAIKDTWDIALVYEEDRLDSLSNNIGLLVFDMLELKEQSYLRHVNEKTFDEHSPKVAYSTEEKTMIAAWNYGVERNSTMTTRQISGPVRKGDIVGKLLCNIGKLDPTSTKRPPSITEESVYPVLHQKTGWSATAKVFTALGIVLGVLVLGGIFTLFLRKTGAWDKMIATASSRPCFGKRNVPELG